METTLDFLVSFLIGFVGLWVIFRFTAINPSKCEYKQSMVNIAKIYGDNKKICKELKRYSLAQIQKGNYEYVEVIDTIKRQHNDKI